MNIWQKKHYSLLPDDIEPARTRSSRHGIWIPVLILAFFAAIGLVSTYDSLLGRFRLSVCPSPFDFSTTFVMDSTYTDLTPAGDEAWWDIFPQNGGYVKKELDGKVHKFGIAMFHQLHCLQTLRTKVQALSDPIKNHTGPRDGHIGHCFDFLRQTLLCHADDTIEDPVHFNQVGEHVDGWVEHQCRSTAPLYEMVKESNLQS